MSGFWSVNPTGIEEIACFLGSHHRLGRDHFSSEMLRVWAAGAEFQMAEGNVPMVEIRSFDSRSGHTETLTISDDGVEFVEFSASSMPFEGSKRPPDGETGGDGG